MIRVRVDMNRCQHYGQCVFEAPEIFRLNDDDQLEHEETADESQRANIEAAIDICPMQAISIVD